MGEGALRTPLPALSATAFLCQDPGSSHVQPSGALLTPVTPRFPEAPPTQKLSFHAPPAHSEGRASLHQGRTGPPGVLPQREHTPRLRPGCSLLPACLLLRDRSGPSATSPPASRPPLPWPRPLMAGGSPSMHQPDHQGALLGLRGTRCGGLGGQHRVGRPAGSPHRPCLCRAPFGPPLSLFNLICRPLPPQCFPRGRKA